MTTRQARWVASVLLALATAGMGISTWLLAQHGPPEAEGHRLPWVAYLDVLGFYAAAAIGALLAVRRPPNPIGWLLLGMGTAFALQDATGRYASLAYADQAELPVGGVAVHADWFSSWLWAVFLVALPYLLLLFPDGRPPTARWRWLGWAIAVAGGALLLFLPTAMWLARSPTSRLVDRPDEGAFLVVLAALLLTLFGFALAAAAALIVRFRRAVGIERQQLRWIAAAGTALVLALLIGGIGDRWGFTALSLVGELGGVLALMALPAAIGVAVLRYRLYEIDRIVARTVSYALLSGVLATVYLAAVLALSRLLAPFGAGSELAVAAATLVAAAVFAPARRRIQHAVDRRFNRARYDAEQVMTDFRERLRAEVELADVAVAIRSAAVRTVEPTKASLWLPETRR
jgi:hypothetical protein